MGLHDMAIWCTLFGLRACKNGVSACTLRTLWCGACLFCWSGTGMLGPRTRCAGGTGSRPLSCCVQLRSVEEDLVTKYYVVFNRHQIPQR
ncbi:hypothetical protein K491DRAFT_237323 [Lophiostoma macrostomum CBS 122681]|uniref:Secreted protein n=1 Tax=Lophiostoma macrostomum CBS 122681 TaxID=1314788 RepID=A0A6A6TJW0_9PLEO|nr:hypothetical protein K491DRAFT_237323 [Lophiostoma macrostomum CBS 122681]